MNDIKNAINLISKVGGPHYVLRDHKNNCSCENKDSVLFPLFPFLRVRCTVCKGKMSYLLFTNNPNSERPCNYCDDGHQVRCEPSIMPEILDRIVDIGWDGTHQDNCNCRICFTGMWRRKIYSAIENENALKFVYCTEKHGYSAEVRPWEYVHPDSCQCHGAGKVRRRKTQYGSIY